MAEAPPPEGLLELARSYGLQVEYVATDGKTRPAPTGSLLAVLRALGVDLDRPEDAPRALRERQLARWRRRIEPVSVAWGGAPTAIEVRLPASEASATLSCRVAIEGGGERRWAVDAGRLALAGSADVGGDRFVSRRLPMPGDLPPGYHRLSIEAGRGEAAESLVIAAPREAYRPPDGSGKRPWGVFCPLHALHGAKSWGAGDNSDLEALMDWTAGMGGGLVGTLPMLASNFDGPDPTISPYSPTSRLFWNEFYLDLARVPGLADCPAARDLLGSAGALAEVEALRSGPMVDYGRQMRLKRSILGLLADSFFAGDGGPSADYLAFVRDHPDVGSYAAFQAAGERFGRHWRDWPAGASGDDRARHYHLFAQWQADEQLRALSAKARAGGLSWYLDFPVGVDLNSYDVWRHRDSFATGASVGCPPDSVFTRGQNWGFPPLHPDRQREHGYEYLIASFRNHFRYANALRIDHVMGLHRLFWIPAGVEARDGAFVSTPSEEVYAILSVESHRRGAWLVGEDLGTVPPEVEGALKRHAVSGMYVVQYEARPDPDRPLRPVPASTVASVNTHDMPPFAAFWGGTDLDDRRDLGLLDADGLEEERATRDEQRQALVAFLRSEGMLAPEAPIDDAGAVLRATWDWLAASPARVVLLNVEDLWLETEPQNTPNTTEERPNWRRKLRQPFGRFAHDPAFLGALKRVDELRSLPPREPILAPTRPVDGADAVGREPRPASDVA